ILTSRPVLELAAQRLERSGQRLAERGTDSIADMQSHLQATAVPNTNVVELVATGPQPEVLAPLVTAVIDVYRQHLAEAFRDSSAAGNPVSHRRDEPTLASLEQRATAVREQLRDLERDFAPSYLAKNPNVTALRQRLVELERQIAAQREAGQRSTLAQVRDELASAQGAATRIQNQIAKGQKDLGQFAARLNEYKAQQDQLNAVEAAYQD